MPRPFEPIGPNALHLCVDMQRVFAEDTPWRTPWMPKVVPNVRHLIRARPDRVVFSRFIPAHSPETAIGTWRQYYQKWRNLTLDRIDFSLLDILPELHEASPDARVFDKTTYSPWIDGQLHAWCKAASVDTLIVSGAETEVCVAATVLGAVDRGFHVIIATDAICSSSDETHDAMVDIYHQRFSVHVSAATTRTILRHW